jgi:cytochrome c553
MRVAALLLLVCVSCSDEGAEQTPALKQEVAFQRPTSSEASAKVTHGQRISRVLGCHGCHGDELDGQIWDDDPKG